VKICGKCRQAPAAGKSFYCSDCRREKHIEWRRKNPERWAQLQAKSRKKRLSDPAKLEKERKRGRDYWQRMKLDAMNAYGGPVCACCGETGLSFLSIDHVNNDGAEHRRSLGYGEGNGSGAYAATLRWMKRNGYPPGFQVLCMNCNHSKEVNGGVCEHRLQSIQKIS
jgi:hypothetical protein